MVPLAGFLPGIRDGQIHQESRLSRAHNGRRKRTPKKRSPQQEGLHKAENLATEPDCQPASGCMRMYTGATTLRHMTSRGMDPRQELASATKSLGILPLESEAEDRMMAKHATANHDCAIAARRSLRAQTTNKVLGQPTVQSQSSRTQQLPDISPPELKVAGGPLIWN